MCRHISGKVQNIKFYENPLCRSGVVHVDRQTDMTEHIRRIFETYVRPRLKKLKLEIYWIPFFHRNICLRHLFQTVSGSTRSPTEWVPKALCEGESGLSVKQGTNLYLVRRFIILSALPQHPIYAFIMW